MLYKRVALIGDSIFDNESYVLPEESVIEIINKMDKNGWEAKLYAVDGATTGDVPRQCKEVSKDITHLVVSCGGNNALGYIGVFDEAVTSVYDAMQYLSEIRWQFERDYQAMLAEIRQLNKEFALCSIYDSSPGVEPYLLTALTIFNDIIFKEAFKLGVPVLDFRQTFCDPSDYSAISPIEPSESGGEKISRAIGDLMETHDFSSTKSVIYS